MTIQKLRNLITVTYWALDASGATISYTRTDKPKKEFIWHVGPIELMQGLDSCASIDGYTLSPHTVSIDSVTYTFENFTKYYPLSQWESLMLATRHEMEFEESKTVSSLELDELFKALL